ncbi:MAG: hypothetical protein AB7L09_02395 [Nitrospira sp.]
MTFSVGDRVVWLLSTRAHHKAERGTVVGMSGRSIYIQWDVWSNPNRYDIVDAGVVFGHLSVLDTMAEIGDAV